MSELSAIAAAARPTIAVRRLDQPVTDDHDHYLAELDHEFDEMMDELDEATHTTLATLHAEFNEAEARLAHYADSLTFSPALILHARPRRSWWRRLGAWLLGEAHHGV